jgi:hypothetical protein
MCALAKVVFESDCKSLNTASSMCALAKVVFESDCVLQDKVKQGGDG